ncbi:MULTISPECIES: Sec-independent protein translocase subunit TatA [Corynebacterium]|uniref:Sec-independent protein translocase protein TatA n=1 Tax=Corynebacterium auriscanis TaxID=99807 RepID=A0A0A2DR71_9CORY|nr:MULTISPECIES: Sec-independent protein translocase subunit TatA [Corynebacterium]KGM19341.1 hypothetical protein MA47_00130 [Corynebacterium auriscanis]MCX2163772.1 Sec-independent protein translocase subunit TatA [Corynebacterium auriscanis]OFT90323.1 hypothetical protein HMPREF3098_03580 [Corynebacterium sp. HMSC28B08]WJY72671.1 twin arginine translocase protein A [Corynebacterium auriscanis]
MPGPTEWLLILLVVLLLFGATRLPNAARGLGRSMRIFKSEMDEMKTESNQRKGIAAQDPQQPVTGETPEQSAARLQMNQQAQPKPQGMAQPVDPNHPQQP